VSDTTDRIELIKQRQKAARSSTGTKALLIQTFSEDLPWLIEQAEKCGALERENKRQAAFAKANYETWKAQIATLSSALQTAREALEQVAAEGNIHTDLIVLKALAQLDQPEPASGDGLHDAESAYQYLSRLLKAVAPQCEPLPSLLGLATQIDNYIAGCTPPASEPQEGLKDKD